MTTPRKFADATGIGELWSKVKSYISNALLTKANTDGNYPNMSVGNAKDLEFDVLATDQTPYNFRQTPAGESEYLKEIVGGSLAWNQLVPDTGGSVSVPTQSGHKYLTRIGGTDSIVASTGVAISATAGTDNIHDLTAMFGSTIADYIYSLEQANEGAGVAWFRNLFPEDYYAYNAGTIQSVKTSAHIMRDADDNVIGNYPLDTTLELRGIPKLDSNNQLYFDGDTYEPDGTVTRRYGIVDMGTLNWGYSGGDLRFYTTEIEDIKAVESNVANVVCPLYTPIYYNSNKGTYVNMKIGISALVGDIVYVNITNTAYTSASEFKTAMSGVYLVYELAEPTTETADPYQAIQLCDPYGTEEFVDAGVSASTRDVAIPVGHITEYSSDLKGKLEDAPLMPTIDGDYVVRHENGENEYISHKPVWLGTCSSAADARVKEVVCPGFKLSVGIVIGVKFTYSNTYTATNENKIKLNVNNTGDIGIYYHQTAEPNGAYQRIFGTENATIFYVYDGTYWVWLSHSSDDDTSYSSMTLSEMQTGTATTERTVTAATLSSTFQHKVTASTTDLTAGTSALNDGEIYLVYE